ncbi:MAG: decarboxylating NADP(+)-dependent phosphogluconate dehydrogenase [Planctomycetes bacterium]|nr:decarboxylating NADP(+)-dependent phosphogluconate dehydrogenase [Planctomycetota bacterium]MCH9726467.1 decarboxylating NADP(+)-dependent phosphogluconate dehydrogenase [Planctomycetota bacterium]MCH9778276.1 decarboxylating NADP(+)-dependent phosphogluconate dehydrogenase [Planctomycetota bacterium]MCH9792461.1 decarboxylating NADP(+)-dependent phosphogluconate dehydrogenase [Planctomycetota bacterium]
MSKHDIGLVGLAVMGQNLVLNMANHGYSVGVFNRTTSVTDDFVSSKTEEQKIAGYHSLKDLVENLASPRKIMLMVKAGPAVDAIIEDLKGLLSPGDIIIDGGNTHFDDTNRRTKEVEDAGLLFIGTGVSGGEEGALKGPSIMPGGTPAGWPHVKSLLQDISAKVGENNDIPCCEWVGEAGAGHYVKMVHNGIEYGDMQLICESYYILKHALGLTNQELYQVFDQWNQGELESYLIEITRDIFTVIDEETGDYLVDKILDTAKQKGTGKWMSQHALDLGVPTTLITEAVYARCLSAQKDARVRASKILGGPDKKFEGDRDQFIEDVRQALYASKLCSYAQGYVQLNAAAEHFGWKLNNGDIALLWRGGCIIRSTFLQDIKAAFDKNPQLENLLLDDFFRNAVEQAQPSWRRVVSTAVELGLPVPSFTAALSYYDGYRQERLPANLLQAQRDYFGAHTYQRIDKEGTFHTDWIRERRLDS